MDKKLIFKLAGYTYTIYSDTFFTNFQCQDGRVVLWLEHCFSLHCSGFVSWP